MSVLALVTFSGVGPGGYRERQEAESICIVRTTDHPGALHRVVRRFFL